MINNNTPEISGVAARVGDLFKIGTTSYKEGVKFDISELGCNLYICFNSPSYQERLAIKSFAFEMGLYVERDIIFMLFHFKGISWIDAPYNAHLAKNLMLENIKFGKGYDLNIYLVNAANGVYEGGRVASIPADLSRELKKEVDRQLKEPFKSSEYDKNIFELYNKYSSEDMAAKIKKYSVQ